METKVQKHYIYEGFGFAICLVDVSMIKSRGEWTPNIDFNKLQKALLLALASKPICLSGNEIKFVRKYFKLKLEAFGLEFGVTHAAVIEWEAKGDDFAKINPATEKCIRLYILDSLVRGDRKFREGYHEVPIRTLAEHQKAKKNISHKDTRFEFDMKKLQAA